MKAVQHTRPFQLDVVDIPVPPVEPDEVRVKVAYVGICGSDLHRSERDTTPPGFINGHEFCGTLDAIGSQVTDWKVGERAVILPMIACGECWGCSTGMLELCEKGLYEGPGMGRSGGYAEYVSIPAGMLRRLPESLSFEHACLTEPLSVALHGVQRSKAVPSDPAMVMGGGPIGAFCAIGLRARGHQKILVLEPNDSRRQTVASLGIDTASPKDAGAIEKYFGDKGPVVAFDCSGHQSAPPIAFDAIKSGGTLVIIGSPPVPVTLPLRRLGQLQLTITGSIGYDNRDYDEALDHIANGRVPCDQVTTMAKLEDAQHWFEVLLSRESSEIKVLMKP